MEKIISSLILVVILFLASSSNSTTASKEVEYEEEFNYEMDSKKGPEHWGDLRPEEWSMCKKGTMQSPIDLSNEIVEKVSHLGIVKRKYRPSNATLVNEGHAMKLSWEEGAGFIQINGNEYELEQMHWHSPSEHTIKGQRFDLEAHLVHKSKNGSYAVIAIIYKLGHGDSFLYQLKKDLIDLEEIIHEERMLGMVDPRRIKIGSHSYFRYQGSLTTPPCNETVTWTIVNKVMTISKTQLEMFVDALHDESGSNARPLQLIHARKVQLFTPEDYQ